MLTASLRLRGWLKLTLGRNPPTTPSLAGSWSWPPTEQSYQMVLEWIQNSMSSAESHNPWNNYQQAPPLQYRMDTPTNYNNNAADDHSRTTYNTGANAARRQMDTSRIPLSTISAGGSGRPSPQAFRAAVPQSTAELDHPDSTNLSQNFPLLANFTETRGAAIESLRS